MVYFLIIFRLLKLFILQNQRQNIYFQFGSIPTTPPIHAKRLTWFSFVKTTSISMAPENYLLHFAKTAIRFRFT